MKSYEIVLNDLSELMEHIDSGNREAFIEAFHKTKGRLHNASVGNSFLKEAIRKVYADAISKFILEEV